MITTTARNDIAHAAGWGRAYARDLAARLFGTRPVASWPEVLTIHPRDAALYGDATEGSPAALAFADAAQAEWTIARTEYAAQGTAAAE